MDPVLETRKTPERPKKTAAAAESFDFNQAIDDLKRGEIGGNVKRLFEVSPLLSEANRAPLLDYLHRHEACSPEFAKRFLADRALQNRVKKFAQSMAESGEGMLSLEEAEVYCELMEPGDEDAASIIEAASPKNQFKGLIEVKSAEIARQRMIEFWRQLDAVSDPQQQREAKEYIQAVFERLGLGQPDDPATLNALLSDPEKMQTLMRDEHIRDLYAAHMEDRNIDSIARSVEFYWQKDESGENMPVMYVERYAVNPKTNNVSKLGFEITLENEIGPDGKKRRRRVIKNVMIVIDKQARGSNEGSQFLISLLPMTKKFGIEVGEFIADLKVGSYNWAKITDMDVPSMVATLSPAEKAELGEDAKDEKKAKAYIMRHKILPAFEQKMAIAIGLFLQSVKDPEKKREMKELLVTRFMEEEFGKLKEKALAGEATMEDLANLGRDLRIFRFDEDGNVVSPDDPKAKIEGHLGKAALMGIPWKARIPFTRESLFGIIDKLQRDGGTWRALMQKMGLLLTMS